MAKYNKITYERLLEKFKNDPEFYKKYKERVLYLQRVRFHNPEVREKHRLACIKSKEKKKCQQLPQLQLQPQEDFNINFD